MLTKRDKIKNKLNELINKHGYTAEGISKTKTIKEETISASTILRLLNEDVNVSNRVKSKSLKIIAEIVEIEFRKIQTEDQTEEQIKDQTEGQILNNNISRNTDNVHFKIDKIEFECSKKYLHLLHFEDIENGKTKVRII